MKTKSSFPFSALENGFLRACQFATFDGTLNILQKSLSFLTATKEVVKEILSAHAFTGEKAILDM